MDKRVKGRTKRTFSPLLIFGKKSTEFSKSVLFDTGYVGAADGEIFGNLSLGQWLLAIQTVAAADHLVFLWGEYCPDITEKIGNAVPFETIIHNINGWTFNDIEKADLIAFPVCADGFIERNFSGTFPAGTKHHEKLIVDAPCSISGKFGSPAGIKGGNGFDQTYGAYGDQIILILVTSLIFFCNMCYEAEIVFDKDILLPDRPFGAAEDRTALPQKKAVSERFSRVHLKGDFLIAYEPDVLFVLFQQKLYKKDRGEHLLRHILIWCIIIRYE